MEQSQIETRIREEIEASDLRLSQIAGRANVPYHTVARWLRDGKPSLRVVLAERLYETLTGNKVDV